MNIEDVIAELDRNAFRGMSEADARSAFSRMAKVTHPDVSDDPRARAVFERLVSARAAGHVDPKGGRPKTVMTGKDGKSFAFRPLSETVSDFGRIVTLNASLTEIYDAENADLAIRAVENVSRFKFPDDLMQREMTRFIPGKPGRRDTEDGKILLSFPRKSGQILLSDVVRVKGKVEARTAAWIVSSLMNISCWLSWSGIQHGAVSEKHLLVDPEDHNVALVGGWAFSEDFGKTMHALPEGTLSTISSLGVKGAKAGPETDRILIRSLLLRISKDLPEPVRLWARGAPGPNAMKDYAAWSDAMRAAWGAPQFHNSEFSASDILI